MGRKYGLGKYGANTYDLGGDGTGLPPGWVPVTPPPDFWVPIPPPGGAWTPAVLSSTEIWVPIPSG